MIREKLRQIKDSPLFLLYFTIFVNNIGFGIILPLLPFYAKNFQASETTAGFLVASYAVAQFIFSTFWGQLSDCFGRKIIITIGVLGSSLSFLVFGLAQNLAVLFIARFLQGVFSAAALPVARAYISDTTTKEERTVAMGHLGAALSLGFILGPAIGGFLSEVRLYFPFIFASIVSFLNFIFVWVKLPAIALKKPEKFVLKESLVSNFKQVRVGLKSSLLPHFVMMGVWAYAIANNQIALPLLGSQKLNLSASQVSWLFTVMGFVSVVVQAFFIGKISKKYGEEKTIKVGLLFMAATIFIMSFSPTAIFLIIMVVSLAFGSALVRPMLNSIVSKGAVEGQGTTMGIAVSFEAIGRILGPAMGGYLFQKFYGFGSFWIPAFVIIFFLAIYNKNYLFSLLKLKTKN